MQAGDTLNFIQPFNGVERIRNESEAEADLEILIQFLAHFINDQPENVNSFEVLEPYGMATVFEGSYKLSMPDASYLHIAVYGSQIEAGLVEFGISVNEHLADGSYDGGHSYLYDANGLTRSTSRPEPVDGDDEFSAELLRRHYMPSDHYADREYLAEATISDDMEARMHAEDAKKILEMELEFDALAEASGFDSQPPLPGELAQLRELIWDAEPFPLHIQDAV